MPNNLLTVKQVAEKFQKSDHSIWRWIKEGFLPANKKGNAYFIKQSDINKLLNRCKYIPVIKEEIKCGDPIMIEIKEKQNYTCQECGLKPESTKKIVAHHIKPLSSGGEHSMNNLITLCVYCHRKEHIRLKVNA